jgi:hypothetical protein
MVGWVHEELGACRWIGDGVFVQWNRLRPMNELLGGYQRVARVNHRASMTQSHTETVKICFR